MILRGRSSLWPTRKTLRADVSERSRAAAKSAFDMSAYASKLEAIALQAVGTEELVRREVEAIVDSGKFRADFFEHPAVETLPEHKIVEAYVRSVAIGLGVRKPMPGFHPLVYSSLQRTDGKQAGDPFVDFLQKGLPEGPWLQHVIQRRRPEQKKSSDLRVALHMHVFYPDQLTEIVERLSVNASTPDLFLSVSSRETASQARAALSGYRGRIVQARNHAESRTRHWPAAHRVRTEPSAPPTMSSVTCTPRAAPDLWSRQSRKLGTLPSGKLARRQARRSHA